MKKMIKKGMAVVLSLAMLMASGVITEDSANAATKTKLSKTSLALNVGKSQKLILKNAKGKVTWKSSNKSVATVSSKGVVKAEGPGSAKITAKNKNKKYTCKVKVKDVVYPAGKVLNIYCWNDEFKTRFEQYYPKYDNGWIGDVRVNFVEVPNEETKYRDALNKALRKQSSVSANEKVDIFLAEGTGVEASIYGDSVRCQSPAVEYSSKMNDYAIPISELGISNDDLSQMFEYTKQEAMDEDGVIRGLSWQACPGGMIYRRSLAKKLFGTDDPEKIQEKVSNWDTFLATGKEIKEKSNGKAFLLATSTDIANCFSKGRGMFDENGYKSVSEELRSNGLVKCLDDGIWGEKWGREIGIDGGVFAYFGPKWFVDFSMPGYSGAIQDNLGYYSHVEGKDSYGDWALCIGPHAFYWGGSWLFAAKGTDNQELVADIMKTMTCDQGILYDIANKNQDSVNSLYVSDRFSREGVTSGFLGGQDYISMYKKIAMNISYI